MTDVRPDSSWFERLRALRRARADPQRIGDAAVMQTRLLGGVMTAHTNEQVRALAQRHGGSIAAPQLDLGALSQLSPGTFGRAVADFCEANAIVLASISDDTRADLEDIGAAARYICLHDVFHVVLECDTSLPEELRITAFILEQRYFKLSRVWLGVLYVLGPLLRPWSARRTLANIRRGRALARRAPMLLAEPLELWFEDDLHAVRERLRLAP